MKKMVFAAALALAFAVPAQAELAHMDGNLGNLDITGHIVTEEDGHLYLFVLGEFENTCGRPISEDIAFYTQAYQGGLEIDYAFPNETPEGYVRDADDIDTGYTFPFYSCYELKDLSEVKLVIMPEDFSTTMDVIIDPSEDGAPDDAEEDVKEAVEETSEEEPTLADLMQRIEELEQRVSALEGN